MSVDSVIPSSRRLAALCNFKRYVARILAAIVAVLSLTAAQASLLATSFAANNSGGGISFDIETTNTLTITGLDLNLRGTGSVSIYKRTGTWEGFSDSAATWDLVGTFDIANAVANTAMFVDLADFLIGPGITGLYITQLDVTGPVIRYTNGTSNYSNSDLTVYAGAGRNVGGPFEQGAIQGRMFSGTVYYNTGDTTGQVPEPASLYLAGIALAAAASALRRRPGHPSNA